MYADLLEKNKTLQKYKSEIYQSIIRTPPLLPKENCG